MYLTKLYRYNKLLFAAILFFIVMQLLVSYKRGMVISPWYNYGMYSEKIYPKKVYEVNMQLTRPGWLYLIAPQYDDKVNLALDSYRKLAQNDSLYQNEITRLFRKFHLPVPSARFYQTRFSQKENYSGILKDNGVFIPLKPLFAHSKTEILQAIWDGHELKLPR